jgi:hypothetical protein
MIIEARLDRQFEKALSMLIQLQRLRQERARDGAKALRPAPLRG